MHRAEGTEHFHSLKTMRWLVARKNTPVFRQEHIRPAICPNISESPHLRICLSTRTPALQKQPLKRSETSRHNSRFSITTLFRKLLFYMIKTIRIIALHFI